MLEGLPEKSSVSKCCAVQTSASFNRVLACSSSQAVSNDWGVPSEYFMSSRGSLVSLARLQLPDRVEHAGCGSGMQLVWELRGRSRARLRSCVASTRWQWHHGFAAGSP